MITKNRLKVSALVLSIPLLTLSGCTTNPYTGQQQISSTGIGVGVGAASGALLGQIIGGNTTSTLVGAGIGAALGGAAGGYMDYQAVELRKQLQGTGVSVVKNGNNIQLVMPGDITFAFNSANINPSFNNVLNSVAIVLRKYNRTTIRVAGYTDNVGGVGYNQLLSQQRAQSVANYLMSQGVGSNRFSIAGYGKGYPIATNSTAAGRAKNRRVTITLQQVGQ